LRTIISKAVWAAYQKSKLLGEMSAKRGIRSNSPLESPGIPTERLTSASGSAELTVEASVEPEEQGA